MSTLAIAAALLIQASSGRVTLEAKAASVSSILAQISTSTGTHLACDEETGRLIGLFSLHNVEVTEFMARCAKVFDAEWKPTDDGFKLTLTSHAAGAERAASIAARAKALDSAITTAMAGLKPIDEASAKRLTASLLRLETQMDDAPERSDLRRAYDMTGLNSPYNRAVLRLIRDIPVTELAEIPPEHRKVYALTPTAKQTPLGPHAAQILADMTREQRVWSDWLARAEIPKSRHGEMTSEPLTQKEPLPKDSRVILIETGSDASYTSFSLVAETPRGSRYLTQFTTSLTAPGTRPAPVRPPTAPDPEIVFSPETVEFEEALKHSNRQGVGDGAISEAMLARLSDPIKFEPLSLLLLDGLKQIAHGRNLIAWIPDRSFALAIGMAAGKSSLPEWRFRLPLENSAGVQIVLDAEWLTARPGIDSKLA